MRWTAQSCRRNRSGPSPSSSKGHQQLGASLEERRLLIRWSSAGTYGARAAQMSVLLPDVLTSVKTPDSSTV